MGQRFKGQIANAQTVYVPIPVTPGGRLYIDVQWTDATSNATITLETTGSSNDDAPVNVAGSAWQWKTEAGITITGPNATAAGSFKVHTTALCCRRARLKIVTAAICNFEIYSESDLGGASG